VGAASAEFDGFIGTGQMSRNARFGLHWDPGQTGPASVVVKIPSGDAGTRAVSFEHRVYERECSFYQSIADHVDVVVPECLAVHFDADASDFVIVLEDLAGSVQGDQFREATTAELRLAISQAAALQAPVWNRTDDAIFDGVRDDVEERAKASTEMLGFFIAVAIERLGPGLDGDIVTMLNEFSQVSGDWVRASRTPTTLVHGDFRPDNFMYAATEDAPPIAVLHGIGIATTATALAERTERGDALFTQMINRHGRQVLDLAALDLF